MGGGGANQPLINSLNTLNTLKNSNPKELAKNLNKIQNSNQLDLKIQDSKKSKLQSLQKDSKIQSKTISKIGISIIASVLLSQNLVAADLPKNALPSGGKFTHGSGSIKVTGTKMDITGNNTNHIIAWGGGFNIGKDAEVNFNTSHGRQASFLNLDYTNKASQILGNLNGNGNNIYLVNPSGVLIGQNASINANKFVASNTIDDTTLNNFKNKVNDTNAITTFSPVFKPNKGNIVNLGTIKANNGITLIGNEVVFAESAKIINQNGNTQNDSITLIGNELDMRAQYIKGKVITSIEDKASIQISTTNLYGYENFNIETQNYNGINSAISIKDFKGIATIGKEKGNNAESLRDWYYFAKGWNEGKNQIRDLIDDFVLLSDIDFGKNEKISLIDGTQLNFSGNYADPNGDGNYDDSMIVGRDSNNAFTTNFNGNGHTLKNVDIKIDKGSSNKNNFIGIFGNVKQSEIHNLQIDNVEIAYNTNGFVYGVGSLISYAQDTKIYDIGIKDVNISFQDDSNQSMVGGVVGWLTSTSTGFDSVNRINVENVSIDAKITGGLPQLYVGGFVGYNKNANISNVSLSDIGTLKAKAITDGNAAGPGRIFVHLGGFIGHARNAELQNVFINNATNNGTISGVITNKASNTDHETHIGGIIGYGYQNTIKEVAVNGMQSIVSSSEKNSYVGGGIGYSESNSVHKVKISNIGTIDTGMTGGAGGLIGKDNQGEIEDIRIQDIGKIESYGSVGGVVGSSQGGTIQNAIMEDIGTIESQRANAGGVMGYSSGGVTIKNVYISDIENIKAGAQSVSNMASSAGVLGKGGEGEIIENILVNNIGSIVGEIAGALVGYVDEDDKISANKVSINNVDNLLTTKSYQGTFHDVFIGMGNSSSIIENGIVNNVKYTDYQAYDNTPKDKFVVIYNGKEQEMNDYDAIQTAITNGKWDIKNDSGLKIYYFDEILANIEENYIPTITSPSINNSAVTFPTIDLSNLDSYFTYNPTKDDFNQSILDSILGKDNQGNSNLIFDLLTQDLESIRQSLDFLVSFLDGENDIKELFGDYYKVNDNIYGALNQDLTINLKFSNFIEALKQNKNINLAFLKDYRDKLNTYNQNKELYQSGGLPPLEQESLKKLLEEQYNELLNLEQTAKINLESLQGLIKDSFKMDTNYTIFTKESLSPLNFTINIGSLNNFEDTQGNGDNNNRFTPPSEVQKIADLASKEAILILPAQEKQEDIVEDGKERGRLCIVSDNAKTNNPCMAITY